MSLHIKTEYDDDIAKLVIMPGDPVRVKFIAENYLDDYKLVNNVRLNLAYTGYYKGVKVTVMSSGMGCPSMAIYAKELFDYWMEKCKKLVNKSSIKEFKQSIFDIVSDFEKIEIDTSVIKPKVGIVGEVLIKYHPFGNNFVADKLEQEGAEVILPDFMGFIKFIATHKITFNKLIKTDAIKAKLFKTAIKLIDLLEKPVISALNNSKKGYLLPCNIWDLEEKVNDILSIGNQTGEGWFLTAEMIEYIEHDIPNIVCVQPFACLPNHVVGKGVIKTIRSKFPEANIAPIDYDPGASEANQTNRIKLMMTVAKDNLKNKNNINKAIKKENYIIDEKNKISN